MKTAVVVGGGIVGAASAFSLQTEGFAVTLVDAPGRAPSASWGNAGHIAIEQVEPLASWSTLRAAPRRLVSSRGALSFPASAFGAWAPFGWRFVQACGGRRFLAGKTALTGLAGLAMPAWTRFAEALGAPGLLRREGHFVAWTDPAAAAAGRAAWSHADTGAARFRNADPDELSRLGELTRRPLTGAIRCLDSGQICDPDDLAHAMRTALAQAGVTLRDARARALEIEGGRARIRVEDSDPLDADLVVITAGVASRPLLETVGYKVPMIAERGYHVQYPGAAWPADLPPIVFEDYSAIVTRFRSGVRISSFLEFSTPDRPADPAKWRRLERHARDLGLPFEAEGKRWMGARPTLPDYLPAIGRSRRAQNLLYAFGHQHLGLTLGPITGELIAALASGRSPGLPTSPFDIERFQTRGDFG